MYLVRVEIREVLLHHFAIRLRWQFVNAVSTVGHDIVQNSIVSVDEVLVSFHFHC